jgi:hypothetical protein
MLALEVVGFLINVATLQQLAMFCVEGVRCLRKMVSLICCLHKAGLVSLLLVSRDATRRMPKAC